MPECRYLLGVDGGGTKTVAVLAALDQAGLVNLLGVGRAGDSNPRLSGEATALRHLGQAIDEAMSRADIGAGVDGGPEANPVVDCAVLALAGVGSDPEKAVIAQWLATQVPVGRVEVVHDAQPLLAIGTPENWGVALIAGTGSVAVGRSATGSTLMRGGWGHWFGDLGSGYDLGRRALAAVAAAEDALADPTRLREGILEHFGLSDPRMVTRVLADRARPRREIAALAPLVFEAAALGDGVARAIAERGARELARLVISVASGLALEDGFPLALTGGALCGSATYRDALLQELRAQSPAHGECALVREPVLGCLAIARRRLADEAPGQAFPSGNADLLGMTLADN